MKADLKELIMLVVIDIIALSLTPTVADAVAQAVSGATGIELTLLPILTWLFILCILGANLAVLYKLFKG